VGRKVGLSDDKLRAVLMQLGAQIAFENYRARWNRIFNVESDNLYTPQPNQLQESRSA
jgi:hypothetical protein